MLAGHDDSQGTLLELKINGHEPVRGSPTPRRGISILEIGKLKNQPQERLRDSNSGDSVIAAPALRIVEAMELGLEDPPPTPLLSSRPDAVDNVRRGTDRQTTAEDV